MMVVTVRSYVMLPNAPPDFRLGRPLEVQVDERTTVSQLTKGVLGLLPGEGALVAIDGQLADEEVVLTAENRVDLFPPIMGG
jgi:sulfur carrier protein ThiS